MTSEQPSATGRAHLLRRPVFWLVAVVLMITVALGVIVAIAVGNSPEPADAVATPAAGQTTTPDPTAASPVSTPSPEPTTSPVGIPTDCREIYTKDWTPQMAGRVLNPAWASDPTLGTQDGTHNAEFASLLATTKQLTCHWGAPDGGSGRFIVTNIAALTIEQQAGAIANAQTNGFSCYPELDGTRCVIETVPDNDGQLGESHFFRDGIWIATLWTNLQPDGYTQDIVEALFGV